MIAASLQYLGMHARLVLPVGIVMAIMLPEFKMRWDLILPVIITFIYAASLIRLDLKQCLKDAFRPRNMLRSIGLSLLILCGVPLTYAGLARLYGLGDIFMTSLVWYAVAPPIASTIWICTMLGFKAALAMEIVIISSLAAPFTGPFIASLILQDIAAIDPLPLFFKLAVMIFGGGLIAFTAQMMLGRHTIERHGDICNGLSALAMLIFLVPVFNGMGGVIRSDLALAGYFLILATVMLFGIQIMFLLLAYLTATRNLGSVGEVLTVVTGSRNVGLYFAALPPDPAFALFTAIYQIPLYLTPLMLGALSARLKQYEK